MGNGESTSRLALDAHSSLRRRIDERLAQLVASSSGESDPLGAALCHALLGSGKRLRPTLSVLVARDAGADEAPSLDAGCAVEMLHAASLIFDDLPAMDASIERRGQPATHRVYGEAEAMLAGIALIARAFGVIQDIPSLNASTRSAMGSCLSCALGASGLAGGQIDDLRAIRAAVDLASLESIGARKTGALFVAALGLGALASGLSSEATGKLCRAGQHWAIAYQIEDDLRDCTEDAGRCGFVSVLGRSSATWRRDWHLARARDQLDRGLILQYVQTLFGRSPSGIDASPSLASDDSAAAKVLLSQPHAREQRAGSAP